MGSEPPVFRKVLIANRGEIALRVMRACRDLGIPSVAVYSSVDRAAPHVRMAQEAHEIGPAPASESYLRIDRLLDVARKSGAEAIHPGYGFLAENAEFAQACEEAGVVFIGPPATAMRAMGDKVSARELMARAGVPVVPGSAAFRGEPGDAHAAVEPVGYPLMIKAAAGGGGKGMRVVERPYELERSLERARSEAKASFGDETVYFERFLRRPRHIEVQVLFDREGRGVAIGERECSIQRRHQKLVEETPSPVVDTDTRARIGEWALAAAAAVGYVNAGTVEFLRDEDGSFYFMEMNTRLQVEHPVTEEVYGIDLVSGQIRVAAGERLPFSQEQLVPRGHAIECRLTAEDPEHNFLPCPGRIEAVRIPSGPGIRDDSAVAPGYTIPVHYDPMVAKLIAHGADRSESIPRMRRALDEYRLEGLTTNIPFLRRLMDHPAFIAGDLHTGFLDQYGEGLLASEPDGDLDEVALLAAAIHSYRRRVESALEHGQSQSATNGSQWLRLGRMRALRGQR
ncbi:MAG: acetyl-CoA carboxylase biotin carboxylase subunit [Acidobacteriota bacterium]|nr:MAG: acetyl-CoA carboxylase biotin carboxylase subunit [Acidobacteriota bacterium]